jgi:hypothetical protein
MVERRGCTLGGGRRLAVESCSGRAWIWLQKEELGWMAELFTDCTKERKRIGSAGLREKKEGSWLGFLRWRQSCSQIP